MPFGWDIGMGAAGLLLLVGGALVLGLIVQLIGETRTGYEWLVAGVFAVVGGWLGSESFGTASTVGPAWSTSCTLLPALIGGVVLGGIVDIVVRTMTGGSYVHHPRPI